MTDTVIERSPSTGPDRPSSPVPPTPRRRPPQAPPDRDGSTVIVFFVAVVALVASVVGVGFGMRAIDESKEGGAAAGAGGTVTVDVELGDLFVKPASVEVAAGSELVVNVTNNGAVAHDLKLGGVTGTGMIDPGGSETVSLGVIEESAEAWCTVPGHKAAGMVMAIEVTGAAAGGGAGTGGAAAEDESATIDFAATQPAEFTAFDPTLAPAPGGVEHQLTFHATETVVEVAPGVTQEVWTFNDQVPGPVLRGKVGDVFTLTLVNDGKLGHSIDVHASKVAWNDEMRTINPGESLVYQFEAKYAGIYMYHCGTAPALHHIGNGMFGAIVIDPPGLPAVDHEYVLVQSELYLGPEGQPGDLAKMQGERHDAVVFNGYVNQYKDRPIRVEPGQRVRVWVLDAGPSENSAFHIVGTVFDTVYKEGDYTLRPGSARGGAQVLDLQPAQGGFVEFTFDEPGLYPIVTHKFANVGKGALGLFQAGDVEAHAGAGH
ncbi:MAG TPA: multicopper oxidase domain-containing protein [Acidimicrobiales bacterium]|nr:multicopper oxidase domain-containing protein [Acidimicrobiales bacterium]